MIRGFAVTASVVLLACGILSSLNRARRQDTMRGYLQAVDVAHGAFGAWERDHPQASLVLDREVTGSFTTAYRAIGAAATQPDDLSLYAAQVASDSVVHEVRTITAP